MSLLWYERPVKLPKEVYRRQAFSRQAMLAKPPKGLGRLESVAVMLAAMQATARPAIDPVHISVFAADHGVAGRTSSVPLTDNLTQERMRIFSKGGSAMSVLARHQGARFETVHLGTFTDVEPMQGVISRAIGPGTRDFTEDQAMTAEQCLKAMGVGRDRVDAAWEAGCRLWLAGEMGRGGSTAAAAVASILLDLEWPHLVAANEGDAVQAMSRADCVAAAKERHRLHVRSPALDVLQCVGGFDMAAQVGGFIRCAQLGMPGLVDGVVGTAAALLATALQPGVNQWLLFAHLSTDPIHRPMLDALQATTLLELGIALGEGSGAAIALGVLRQACLLHNDMATVDEMSWD